MKKCVKNIMIFAGGFLTGATIEALCSVSKELLKEDSENDNSLFEFSDESKETLKDVIIEYVNDDLKNLLNAFSECGGSEKDLQKIKNVIITKTKLIVSAIEDYLLCSDKDELQKIMLDTEYKLKAVDAMSSFDNELETICFTNDEKENKGIQKKLMIMYNELVDKFDDFIKKFNKLGDDLDQVKEE